MRSRKRFIVFTSMYVLLTIWMSFSMQQTLKNDGNALSLTIAVVVSIFLSILYAWIIINYRRMEIATMKCIGYTNNNIRTIIFGELIWVTMISFFVVAEIMIHTLAINAYIKISNGNAGGIEAFIDADVLIYTILIFLVSQLGGIWIAYRKILKLRPIMALRVMK